MNFFLYYRHKPYCDNEFKVIKYTNLPEFTSINSAIKKLENVILKEQHDIKYFEKLIDLIESNNFVNRVKLVLEKLKEIEDQMEDELSDCRKFSSEKLKDSAVNIYISNDKWLHAHMSRGRLLEMYSETKSKPSYKKLESQMKRIIKKESDLLIAHVFCSSNKEDDMEISKDDGIKLLNEKIKHKRSDIRRYKSQLKTLNSLDLKLNKLITNEYEFQFVKTFRNNIDKMEYAKRKLKSRDINRLNIAYGYLYIISHN